MDVKARNQTAVNKLRSNEKSFTDIAKERFFLQVAVSKSRRSYI